MTDMQKNEVLLRRTYAILGNMLPELVKNGTETEPRPGTPSTAEIKEHLSEEENLKLWNDPDYFDFYDRKNMGAPKEEDLERYEYYVEDGASEKEGKH